MSVDAEDEPVAAFVAAPGERNVVAVTRPSDATLRFHDDGAPVTAGPGCRQIGPSDVACDRPEGSDALAARVDCGTGMDEVHNLRPVDTIDNCERASLPGDRATFSLPPMTRVRAPAAVLTGSRPCPAKRRCRVRMTITESGGTIGEARFAGRGGRTRTPIRLTLEGQTLLRGRPSLAVTLRHRSRMSAAASASCCACV